MSERALMEKLAERADTLLRRAEVLRGMVEVGEGASVSAELEAILDEMRFLRTLGVEALARAQVRLEHRRFRVTEARLRAHEPG